MKYFISTLIVCCLFLDGTMNAQSRFPNTLTIGVDLNGFLAFDDFLLADYFLNIAHSPVSIPFDLASSNILVRMRPGLRIGYTLGPKTEVFGHVSTYGTKIYYDTDADDEVASGTTFAAGGGFRWYRRKKKALAPMGKFFEVGTYLHRGNNKTEDGDFLSRQTAAELRLEIGKQYPFGDKFLITTGAGLGLTSVLAYQHEDRVWENLEFRTQRNYFLTNALFFKIGLAIMP